MHNPTSVLNNDIHKLLWDFDVQTDHLISTRRPDLIIINRKEKKKKRNCRIVDFAVPTDHRAKLKESEKKDKYLALARELKKTVEHESDVYINYNWCSWYSYQKITKRTGGFGNKRTSGDYSNYCIVEILLRTTRILRRVLETWRDLLSFRLQWKTIC